ncbi:iron ABC transporter permease [uncultured Thiodictyon sp.]|uniref:FecCD family ABC transporter permease n=1 Tax=uncultured Thiodictyon sp. TaxID=1846217 RepID=UPI0025FB6770|nr:iron ABC transporter permease [uncultured Thiodictyon sp.]
MAESHPFGWLLALALLLPVAMLLSLSYGRFPLTPGEVAATLMGLADPDAGPARAGLLQSLVYEIRLPRVLAAALIGAALAASGTAYQAVFVNPLVSPGILGVLAGASCGAALGLLAGQGWWLVQLLSIGGGLAAMLVGIGIGRLFGVQSLVMLVLGGIFSGALFSALLSLVKYLADPYEQLPAIVYWLMGSLGQVDGATLWRLAPPMLAGILGLAVLGRALDALAMGDDAARSLGVPVRAVRGMVIGCATVASALTVAIAGTIGWVGLLVPHMARLLVGPLNRYLVPASALLGAVFLLAADALARGLGDTELPIGIVTELVGLPIFLLVLRNVRRGWGS